MRLKCCVPFCERTRGYRKNSPISSVTEFICGEHWQTIPKAVRRQRIALISRYKKRFGDTPFWHYGAGSPKRLASVKLSRLIEMSWRRCKRYAIKRAL